MQIAANGDGAKGSAVIATKPPSAPFSIITTSVLPPMILVMKAFTMTPAHAARFVLIKILAIAVASAKVPNASCDPPLNPNQPNHNTKTPNVAKGIEEEAKGVRCAPLTNLPNLGPNTIAPAKAAAP